MDSFTNSEPVYCSLSASNCCFLNCIQVSQKMGKVGLVCPSPKEFSTLLWSTQFSEINKADVFLEFPCFLYVPANVGNLISGSSDFSKCSMNIWNFWVHIILKHSLEELSIILLAWEMSATVQWLELSLVLPFLGTGMRIDLFRVLWPLLCLPDLLT